MDDSQFRKLHSAVLDLKVAVSDLALAVRSMPRCPYASEPGVDDAEPCVDPDAKNPAIAELLRNAKSTDPK
jgi:hypothetical protein